MYEASAEVGARQAGERGAQHLPAQLVKRSGAKSQDRARTRVGEAI